ncbi:DUF2971 domain-containing protein [Kiloniella majae]|uniref:DUF2971 domain-containing protein n=1 Tax=Kiloniella majae TaxID=1938558 RepID=UPI000A277D61|nr:DUF2971 domain-containing protein [Kiloniella majae]
MTLYKYVACNEFSLDILRKEKIRYTQPAFLNDPYEMLPNVQEIISTNSIDANFTDQFESSVKEVIDEKIPHFLKPLANAWVDQNIDKNIYRRNMNAYIKAIQPTLLSKCRELFDKHIRRGVGVLSLSSDPESLLMWSHYADEHRGFIIEIDENHPCINSPRSEDDEFFHPRPVLYSEKRPSLEFSDLDGTILLLTKSLDWGYEKEWRVIKPISSGSQSNLNKNVYLFDLPADAIQGIILGANMGNDQRQQVENIIISNDRYAHIKVKEAQLQANSYSLKVRHINFRKPNFELNKNITIEVNDIKNQDDIEALASRLGETLRPISRTVDVRFLDRIIVANDLASYAQQILGDEILHLTDNTITLILPNEETFQIWLLIQADEVNGLMKFGNPIFHTALYNFHKALLRVQDLTNRWQMLGEESMGCLSNGRLQYLNSINPSIWTEYYVTRNSLIDDSEDIERDFLDLKTRFDITQKLIEKKISEYRTHGNLEQLLSEVIPIIGKMMRSIAFVVGLAHKQGHDLSLLVLADAEKNTVEKLSQELNYLHRYYPNWDGLEEFFGLTRIVESYVVNFGICFDTAEENKTWVAVL